MVHIDKSRSAAYQLRHNANPYVSAKQACSATVYQPDEYTLSQICALSARAIRVLMILASRHDPTTGLCHCSKLDIQRLVSMSRPNLSHATGELIDAGLLAKGKSLDTYFLNPKAFKPVTIHL
ncbi:hypothetical protein [Spirosoma areae]